MRRRFAAAGCAVCLLAGVVCAPHTGAALVVNGDPDDYVVSPPSDYDLIGYTNAVGGACGVLVSPWFVLTAGHVTDYGTTGKWVRFDLPGGSETYNWDPAVIRHPTADLALVRLDRNTGLTGVGLYTDLDEAHQTGILVGYGMSGTGTSVGAGGDWAYPRGTKRAGTNRVDAAAFVGGEFVLRTDFDANGSDVMIALGDSGGPILLDDGGALKVAGIHSWVDNQYSSQWPTWGDLGYSIRVAAYADWINDNIPDLGDFDEDGAIDAADIDLLFDEIAAGGDDLWPYDLTADDLVTEADADWLIGDILGTARGDANLDGTVDVVDLGTFGNNYWRSGSVSWADGDFNGDGTIDVFDLALLGNNYQPGTGGGGQSPLPEPGACLLLASGAAMLPRRKRQGR